MGLFIPLAAIHPLLLILLRSTKFTAPLLPNPLKILHRAIRIVARCENHNCHRHIAVRVKVIASWGGIFSSSSARHTIGWFDVIHRRLSKNQLVNTVHGALKTYDLTDLAALVGDNLTIENPLNANGNPLKK